jgi:hypothetical protein
MTDYTCTYDGTLDSFEIDPATGDVLAWVGYEGYAYPVRIKRTELAGMAEASREAWRMRTVTCERCHLGRPAFELNNCGICVVCVMAGRLWATATSATRPSRRARSRPS